MTTTLTSLRPDVAAMVELLTARDWQLHDPACWAGYDDAKNQLSHLCGYDAYLSGGYDQDQYDLAIQRYLEVCGL